MTELVLDGVSVALGGKPVVEGASLAIGPGELVALLGPNGAGKTTLLRAALGLTARRAGTVSLGGDEPRELAPAERARRASYLPQRRPLAWPMRVRDVVALGRFAHGAAPSRLSHADAQAVAGALAACSLAPLAQRRADTLSGGESSRMHVARALAAGAPLLLADEPTTALDPRHQFQVLSLLRRYVDAGNAALVVLHDAALAARFAHRLAWLAGGRLVADGPPASTLTADRLQEVYGVRASVHRDQEGWCVTVRDAG